MATVDELLAMQDLLTGGNEPFVADVQYPIYTLYNDPVYVTISNKTIANFNSQISIRGEQNAQFVSFVMPRYSDGMDLVNMQLYVHYESSQGAGDNMPCNVEYSEMSIRLSWLIPAAAAQSAESIQFMIYALGYNEKGEPYKWLTLPAIYEIKDGLEIGGSIAEPDTGWYEQFVWSMDQKIATALGHANAAKGYASNAKTSQTAAAQSAIDAAQTQTEIKSYVESEKASFVGYSQHETDLKYANAIIGSASGQDEIKISDAWDAPIKDLVINGESTQMTTTGAQLIDFDEYYIDLKSGNRNEYVGTCPNFHARKINITQEMIGNTYTFSAVLKMIGESNNISLLAEIGGSKKWSKLITENNVYEKVSITFTPSSIEDCLRITYGSGASTVYAKEIMLNAGDTALPWEPYTGGSPSPSPDYPQEIVNVGGKLIMGNNLMPPFVYGVVLNSSTGVEEVGSNAVTDYFTLDTTKTYVWSNIPIAHSSFITAYDIDGNFIGRTGGSTRETLAIKNFTTLFAGGDGTKEYDKIAKFRATLYNGVAEDMEFKTMLNVGNNPLPYEPYAGGVQKVFYDDLQVEVTGKNLFGGKVLADKITSLTAKSVINETNKTVTYLASEIVNKELYTDFEEGKQYTIVLYGKCSTDDYVYTNLNLTYSDGSFSGLNFKTSGKNSYCIIQSTPDKSIVSLNGIWASTSTILYYDKCGIFEGTIDLEEFEPYKQQTATLTIPNGIPGIPVSSGGNYIDANGQEWVSDSIEYRDRQVVYVQRVKVVKISEVKWEVYTDMEGLKRFEAASHSNKLYTDAYTKNLLCSGLKTVDYAVREQWTIAERRGLNYLRILTPIDTTKEEMLEKVGDCTLIYVLADPITTPLAIEDPAQLTALHTYAPTTVISNNADAYMSVEYVKDTNKVIGDLQGQIDDLKNIIET